MPRFAETIVEVSRPVGLPQLPFEAGLQIGNEYFWCADGRVSSVVSSGFDSPHIKWACAILNQAVINERANQTAIQGASQR